MYAFMKGTVVQCENDFLILEVCDIGYRIFVPETLLQKCRPQEKIKLHLHFNVRETAMELYGFAHESELALFRQLIAVSGVGPKTALGIFSLGDVSTIHQAITRGDISFLTSVSGIGTKGAKRIVVELKDKMPTEDENKTGVLGEVRDALVALGYAPRDINPFLQEIQRDPAALKTPAKDLIKKALQMLSRV